MYLYRLNFLRINETFPYLDEAALIRALRKLLTHYFLLLVKAQKRSGSIQDRLSY